MKLSRFVALTLMFSVLLVCALFGTLNIQWAQPTPPTGPLRVDLSLKLSLPTKPVASDEELKKALPSALASALGWPGALLYEGSARPVEAPDLAMPGNSQSIRVEGLLSRWESLLPRRSNPLKPLATQASLPASPSFRPRF